MTKEDFQIAVRVISVVWIALTASGLTIIGLVWLAKVIIW